MFLGKAVTALLTRGTNQNDESVALRLLTLDSKVTQHLPPLPGSEVSYLFYRSQHMYIMQYLVPIRTPFMYQYLYRCSFTLVLHSGIIVTSCCPMPELLMLESYRLIMLPYPSSCHVPSYPSFSKLPSIAHRPSTEMPAHLPALSMQRLEVVSTSLQHHAAKKVSRYFKPQVQI